MATQREKILASIADLQDEISVAFAAGDFETCGIVRDALDRLEGELAALDEADEAFAEYFADVLEGAPKGEGVGAWDEEIPF